jgi:hypothetical protein
MEEGAQYEGLDVRATVYEEDGEARNVLWSGRQWAVTDAGLEGVVYDHREVVPADDLGHILDDGSSEPELDNVFRISEKTWVDVIEFLTAYELAMRLHQGRYVDPPAGTFARSAELARRLATVR